MQAPARAALERTSSGCEVKSRSMSDAGTVTASGIAVTGGALDFDVLHFSTVFPGRALPRLNRRIEDRGAQVVYDLEDTHWIPTDAALTRELKRRARRDLAELLGSPMPSASSFGVKVNAFGTEEGERDVELLASLVPIHRLRLIILPKAPAPWRHSFAFAKSQASRVMRSCR